MLSPNLRSLLKSKAVPRIEPVTELKPEVDFVENKSSLEVEEDVSSEEILMEEESTEDETFLELPVDIYQTNTHVVIHSPVAGAKPEDINVSLKEDILVITRRRLDGYMPRQKSESFLQECYWGEISRSVTLPVPVIAEKSEADLDSGVLTISIPKVRASQTKVIRVRSAGQ